MVAEPTLDSCVRSILCGLSHVALAAVGGLVDTQITVIRANVAVFQAQLLVLDVAMLPVEATQSLVQGIANEVRSAASLIPVDLISGCTDLGDFSVALSRSIDDATADLDAALDDLAGMLSFKEELQLAVDELNAILDLFELIKLEIQFCLADGGSS